jgi:hypothetical protein
MNKGIEQLSAAQPNPKGQGLEISRGAGQALDHAFLGYLDIEVALVREASWTLLTSCAAMSFSRKKNGCPQLRIP